MADVKLQFEPGNHYSWNQRDETYFTSSSRLLLTAVRPPWLKSMQIYISEKDPTARIVLPTMVDVTFVFDRDVDVEWSCSGMTASCRSYKCRLGSFDSSAVGFINVYGRDIQLSILPMIDSDDVHQHAYDPSAPFSFYEGHVFSAYKMTLSLEPKLSNHHFFDSGSSSAVCINGMQNSIMYLKPLESYSLMADGGFDIAEFALCSDHRMHASSVVLKPKDGVIEIPYWLSRNKDRMWYGLVGKPQSGGRVYIASKMPLATPWSAYVGKPVNAPSEMARLPVGNFCLINIAAMHVPCCSSCTVSSGVLNVVNSSSFFWSSSARLRGGVWIKNEYADDFSYLNKKLKSTETLDSNIAIVEPGALSGEFKFSTESFSYLARWIERFLGSGKHAFACAYPNGFRYDDIHVMDAYMKYILSNTIPPVRIACYVNKNTSDACFLALRNYALNSHRDFYIMAMDEDSVYRSARYGTNIIFPFSMSSAVRPLSGRHAIAIDSMPIEDGSVLDVVNNEINTSSISSLYDEG